MQKPRFLKELVTLFFLILFTVQFTLIQKAPHNLRSIVFKHRRKRREKKGGRRHKEVGVGICPEQPNETYENGLAKAKTKQKVVPGIKTRSKISNMLEREAETREGAVLFLSGDLSPPS